MLSFLVLNASSAVELFASGCLVSIHGDLMPQILLVPSMPEFVTLEKEVL